MNDIKITEAEDKHIQFYKKLYANSFYHLWAAGMPGTPESKYFILHDFNK